MDIIGRSKIFKKVFDDGNVAYSTSISNKNEEGKKVYIYIPVQFPKGTELEDKTNIEIKKGFLTFFTTKDGKNQIKLVVMDFESRAYNESQNFSETEVSSGDELPF